MAGEETDPSPPVVSAHNSKCPHPNIRLSTMLLGLRGTTVGRKKSIKVRPEHNFCYKSKPKAEMNKKRSIFIYEARLGEEHAKNVNHVIDIFVKDILVGTLSAKRPWIQLALTLSGDCVLRHNSQTKTVFFNAFSFSPAKSLTFEANKEIWVVEVKPTEKHNVNPVGDGKEYHLLEVYSREKTNESIDLHVCHNKVMQLVGEVVAGCSRTRLNLVFDDDVDLSHSSNTMSLFYSGYTVSNHSLQFELKELNKYTGNPEKDSLKSSPKISLDPENECYKRELAKQTTDTPKKLSTGTPKKLPTGTPKQPEVNLVTVSPLTAPLIFNHRADSQLFSANPRGLYWVPKQKEFKRMTFEENASVEEDKTTLKKPEDGKKRVAETPLKPPVSDKRAKIATPSGQTTGDKKFPGKTNNSKPKGSFHKPVSSHACKSCNKTFGSDSALQSHKKAKHA